MIQSSHFVIAKKPLVILMDYLLLTYAARQLPHVGIMLTNKDGEGAEVSLKTFAKF